PPLGHEVSILTFSPDGKKLLIASGRTCILRDATSGERIGKPMVYPSQEDAPLRTVVFSPDGKRVLTTSRDGPHRLWDAATGEAVGEPLDYSGPEQVLFSPDGKTILATGRRVVLWDGATGKRLPRQFPEDLGWTGLAAWARDGKTVLLARAQDAARERW